MPSHEMGAIADFVNVVAKMDDEIEVAFGHVAIGAVKALLILLAGGESESKPIIGRVGGGRGAGASDTAFGVAATEAVKIPAVGLKAGHRHMHRMAPILNRVVDARANQP